MPRFITQFSVWRQSRTLWFVFCSETKTGEVFLCRVDAEGAVEPLDPYGPLPDIRLLYPCTFKSLPAISRALIRSAFLTRLEETYSRPWEYRGSLLVDNEE